eukprot:694806_1
MSESASTESASARSTKYCVCVASHIHYPTQIKLLDRCLHSLTHQTVSIDVYVSMSGISFSRTEVNSLLRKYSKTVQFTFCEERKYQMEHMHRLYEDIDIDSYELIFFADDDDMYVEERVETFTEALQQQKALLKVECKSGKIFAGIREHSDAGSKTHAPRLEFWSYAIVPYVLHLFFQRFRQRNCFNSILLICFSVNFCDDWTNGISGLKFNTLTQIICFIAITHGIITVSLDL